MTQFKFLKIVLDYDSQVTKQAISARLDTPRSTINMVEDIRVLNSLF